MTVAWSSAAGSISAASAGGLTYRSSPSAHQSPAVAERGAAEGIEEGMAAKVRNSIVLLRKLLAEPGVELRLHGTVLYNSIYRADDQLLVNTHIYGVMANNAPRDPPAQDPRRGDGQHVRRELREGLG